MASAAAGFSNYLAILKASYDYTPQSDDEIKIKEDQLLLLVDKVDEEYVHSLPPRDGISTIPPYSWWKVKIKGETQDEEGPIGLVPAAYVEQVSTDPPSPASLAQPSDRLPTHHSSKSSTTTTQLQRVNYRSRRTTFSASLRLRATGFSPNPTSTTLRATSPATTSRRPHRVNKLRPLLS